MSKSASRMIRSVIEVERKFKPQTGFAKLLEANRGPPPFTNLGYLGRNNFRDEYYDHKDLLFSQGIWVRRRQGLWQAKVRQGGDFRNSQFRELQGIEDISKLIHTNTPCRGSEGEHFGLTQFASFSTFRQTWKVQENFEIVLDETDFGHSVGEVELLQEISRPENSPGEDQETARTLDQELERFMDIHRWAFTAEIPIGKLSAYCALPSSRP